MNITTAEQTSPTKALTVTFALIACAAAGWGMAESRHVTSLERQVSESTAELAIARADLQQALKQALPVVVSYREDDSRTGQVAVFSNSLPRPLELIAMCSSPRTGQRKRFNLIIPSNGKVEIGHEDGWRFMPGQRIILSSSQFRPAESVVAGS